jgi:hypothetical protein
MKSRVFASFRVTQAQVPTAARDEEINRTWFVKGIDADGNEFAGYMPRDECTSIHDPNQLLGLHVEGEISDMQKQPNRTWINYLRPCKEQPSDEAGAIAALSAWQGHLQYRQTVGDAIGEISAELHGIADRLTKTAALLRSLKNL